MAFKAYNLLYALIFASIISDQQLSFAYSGQHNDRPNIVIIIADDMGFDDVSFRGSNRFLTPNIDALAYSGVILKNMYTPAMCSPSRAALLTGKYPINIGMQHSSIGACEPWGLPLKETTMAEIFQKHGYHTSLFGKWHLGMAQKNFTPTFRGFKKHFGYLGESSDYYDQTYHAKHENLSRGHDFRHNMESNSKYVGTYMTNLLTDAASQFISQHNTSGEPLFMILSHMAPHAGNPDDPLQAPNKEVEKFAYIQNKERRIYAAMISQLDKSVAQIIDVLYQKNILENTIILFFSDNGGPIETTASNYPLKGQKNSPWEGGIRSSAAIWSTKIEKLRTVCKQRFYVADILPTLATAADIQLDEHLQLDGVDLWAALKYGYQSVERAIVHNIDEIVDYVAFTNGKWKFVNGTTEDGVYDQWFGSREPAEEVDPRAEHYEHVIRNTSVWQQLNAFASEINVVDNMTQLREDAAVKCLYTNGSLGIACDPIMGPCLFDIDVDPCEQNNLYEQQKNSKLMQNMLFQIENFRENALQPQNLPFDSQCDPMFFNDEWTWWLDQPKSSANNVIFSSLLFFIVLFMIF